MTDETEGSRPTGPVRVVSLYITPAHIPNVNPSGDETAWFTAEIADISPLPLSLRDGMLAGKWFWMQLTERVSIVGGSCSFSHRTGQMTVTCEVPRSEIETAARSLLSAVEDVASSYPATFEAWQRAGEVRRQEERTGMLGRYAPEQAILDRVMDEYGGGGS